MRRRTNAIVIFCTFLFYFRRPLSNSFPGGLTPRPFNSEEHAVLRVFEAARDGDMETVRKALRNMDVTTFTRDSHGNTLLIVAAETGDRKLARMLIRFGIDVNLVNSAGNSALHVANAFRTSSAQSGVERGRRNHVFVV